MADAGCRRGGPSANGRGSNSAARDSRSATPAHTARGSRTDLTLSRTAAILAVVLLFGSRTLPAAADEQEQPVQTVLAISAEHIGYYTDQKMIQARGAVHVHLANGLAVSGDACQLDLSLKRFLVAGHVTVTAGNTHYAGAAFADFLSFRRAYFIPLVAEPDRWTFLNDDFTNPEKGRQMPSDAFFLTDLSDVAPFVTGQDATTDLTNYIAFNPARFVLLNGGLRTPAFAPYVRNFSSNQNFGVNSLSGATFDAPYGIAGSSANLDTLHFRYDQMRKTYGAFEHHSVFGANGYAVFSLNPATQPSKQWNLLGYWGGADNALTLDAQLFTYQYWLDTPLTSNAFIDLQDTQALAGSSLRLEVTQSYDSLLARPPNGAFYHDPSHPYVPNHPLVIGLGWSGYDKHLFRTGWSFRLTSGASAIHDAYGLGAPGKRDAQSQYLGGLLYSPVYRAPFGTGANATYQVQQTWLSFPNSLAAQTW